MVCLLVNRMTLYIIHKYHIFLKLSYDLIDELCILSGVLEIQPAMSVTILMLQRRNFVSIYIPYKKLSVDIIFCKVIFGHFSWMKSWITHIEITQICTHILILLLKNKHWRKKLHLNYEGRQNGFKTNRSNCAIMQNNGPYVCLGVL